MIDKINGGCLCGKVEFEVENQFEDLFFCHCEQCRKLTGSAHASNLFGDLGGFRWLKGEDNVQHFDFPGRQFSNAFCRDCGSGLPFVNSNGTKIIVPAGSLNSEPRFARQSKIFYVEQTQWCRATEQTKTFDGFPED